MCLRRLLAHIRVLTPDYLLESLGAEVDDEDVSATLDQAEPEVEDLASCLAARLDIKMPDVDSEADELIVILFSFWLLQYFVMESSWLAFWPLFV